MDENEESAERKVARARELLPYPSDQLIARAILQDIADRRGWKHQLAETDAEVIESEILPAWAAIVRVVLASASGESPDA